MHHSSPIPHWERPSESAFCIPHINLPLAGGCGGQLTPAKQLPSSEDNFTESPKKGCEHSAAKTQCLGDGCASLVKGIWAGHQCTTHTVNKYLLFIVSPAISRSSSQKHSLPVSRKGAQINPLIHVIFPPPQPSHKAGLSRTCTFLLLSSLLFQSNCNPNWHLFYTPLSYGGGLSPGQWGIGTHPPWTKILNSTWSKSFHGHSCPQSCG